MFGALREHGWAPGVAAGWDRKLTESNYEALISRWQEVMQQLEGVA
jgi:hypothetical protein